MITTYLYPGLWSNNKRFKTAKILTSAIENLEHVSLPKNLATRFDILNFTAHVTQALRKQTVTKWS